MHEIQTEEGILSHEILLERISTNETIKISNKEIYLNINDDLDDHCIKITFLPTMQNINSTRFLFVVHDQFYRHFIRQKFPQHASDAGCFFQICKLSSFSASDRIFFSLLDSKNGKIHSLLNLKLTSSQQEKNIIHWQVSFRYFVDIYCNIRKPVTATVLMGMPRDDCPGHSQKSFLAIHNPKLEKDANDNNYFRYDHVLLRPGHSVRLGYNWNASVNPKTIDFTVQAPLQEWQSHRTEDTRWLREEKGIEKNHPLVLELVRKITAQTNQFWNVTRLSFLKIHKILSYQIIPEEKGCAWALTHRKGDCTEFASVLTAILRNLKIPSRLVSGFYYHRTTNHWSRHAWVEVKSPRNDWILLDPLNHVIGYDPSYLPIYAGNWISKEKEVEIIIKIHSNEHDKTEIMKKLKITTWIEGSIQRKSRTKKKNKSSIVFLEE